MIWRCLPSHCAIVQATLRLLILQAGIGLNWLSLNYQAENRCGVRRRVRRVISLLSPKNNWYIKLGQTRSIQYHFS